VRPRDSAEQRVARRGAPERAGHSRRVPLVIVGLSVALAMLTGAAALAAARSTTRSVTAAGGGTSATVSYRASSGSSTGPPYSDLHLTITRDGSTAYDAAVRSPFCGTACWPDVWPGHGFLTVADADGTGSPDVILDLYSGGAHCCSIVQIYRFDAQGGTYTIIQRDFGDPGASLERLAGSYVFVSADDRFAYTFAAFAFSGLPLAIWRLDTGGFTDVTRRFPALIAADAARQYHAYTANRAQGFGLGFIAAWAADEDLLGHGALVGRTLARANRDGGLRSADGLPQGSAFIAALQRFLIKCGYVA